MAGARSAAPDPRCRITEATVLKMTTAATLTLALMSGCASKGTASKPGSAAPRADAIKATGEQPMRLGNFSVSLSVKDLAASRAFYEKLGFKVTGGKAEHNYLIMQNDQSTIGLYQGMFKGNLLTYNPGWDRSCQTLAAFDDVREIQARLKAQGLTLTSDADPAGAGPASLTLVDPDGNVILVDQHVARGATK